MRKTTGKSNGKTADPKKKSAAKSVAFKAAAAKLGDSGKKTTAAKDVVMRSGKLTLPKELQLGMFDLMVRARVLEERLIKVYKTGDAFFWIGGAGEEAFGVPLGLLSHKGQGTDFDYFHMHYRATPTLIALGMTYIDSIRLQMNKSTDPSTGGRNFCNHYCFPEYNVTPITSPIEVQYGFAIGTAIAQRRRFYARDAKSSGTGGKKPITIVTGGDAGTAEGDFASSLIWSSRPGNELPMLITVQNNKWGISTSFHGQHGEKNIADRGKAFGIRTTVVNGNDPIETYLSIQSEMDYIRRTGKPVLAEFHTSRLYGHSSATGANREVDDCPIELFEKKLVDQKYLKSTDVKALYKRYDDESREAAEIVRGEPVPTSESIWEKIWVGGENADWRKF